MEIQEQRVPKAKWTETMSGNKLSKESRVMGLQNILIKKSLVFQDVTIRGDMGIITFGQYTILRPRVTIRVPHTRLANTKSPFMSPQLGEFVIIDDDAIVEAALIGKAVYIGKNAVLGNGCVIKDGCWVEDGSVVPPDAMYPMFSRISGRPARVVGQMPFSHIENMTDAAKAYYDSVVLVP